MSMLANPRHHFYSFSLTIIFLALTNLWTIVHCSDGDINNNVPLDSESRQHLDDERVDSLKRELENVRNQLNDYEKSMAIEKNKASEEIKHCQEQFAAKESQFNDMSKKTTLLESERERDVAELKTTIETMTKDAESKAKQIQNLETLKTDVAGLKTTIETMTKDADTKEKKILDLEKQVTDMTELKATIETMTKDAESKAKQIHNLETHKTDVAGLKTTIETMTKDVDTKTKKIQDLEKQLTDMTELKATIETMTKDAESKTKKMKDLEKKITDATKLKTTIETMTKDVDSKTKTIQNLEKQLTDMRQDHANVRNNLKQMQLNATRQYCNMTLIRSDTEKFLHDAFDTMADTIDHKSRPIRTTVMNWAVEQSKKIKPACRKLREQSIMFYEKATADYDTHASPYVRQGKEKVKSLYQEHASSHVDQAVAVVKEFYTEFAEDTVNEVIFPFHRDTIVPLLEQYVYPVVIRARDAVVGVRLSLISGIEDKMHSSIDYINELKKEKENCVKTKGCNADDVKVPRDWVVDIISAIEANATQIMDGVLIVVFVVTMGRFVLFLAWSICLFPFRVMWFFSPLRVILDHRRRRANRKVNRAEKRAAEKKQMKHKKSGGTEHVNGGSSKKKNRKLK